MSERFFVEPPVSGPRAILAGDEARHLARVMRAAVGDDVVLFDGSGAEFLARIAALGKAQVELAIVERRPVDRELPFRLTLAVALPKGSGRSGSWRRRRSWASRGWCRSSPSAGSPSRSKRHWPGCGGR
jgi:hypothetical protein